MQTDIARKLREYIEQNILYYSGIDNFGDDDSLRGKNILDSTNVMEIIEFVEKEYNIQISESEITRDNFDSVNKIAQFVAKKSA